MADDVKTASTRERILVKALPLFADHGFAGTSTRMVAKAAKVNVATLAYYFEGKEGLYQTVVQRLHEDLFKFLPETAPVGGAGVADWVARQSWRFVKTHRQHIRLLLRHVLDEGHHERAAFKQFNEPLLAKIDTLLGSFRPDWSAARVRLFSMGITHILVRLSIEDPEQLATQLGNPEDPDEEVVQYLRELIAQELRLAP